MSTEAMSIFSSMLSVVHRKTKLVLVLFNYMFVKQSTLKVTVPFLLFFMLHVSNRYQNAVLFCLLY